MATTLPLFCPGKFRLWERRGCCPPFSAVLLQPVPPMRGFDPASNQQIESIPVKSLAVIVVITPQRIFTDIAMLSLRQRMLNKVKTSLFPVDSSIRLALVQLQWSSTLSVLIGTGGASLSHHRLLGQTILSPMLHNQSVVFPP